MTSPILTRAFLSHSSQDKQFVQQVFNDLGPTLAELDQVTFEPAKFNIEAILRAFDRCSVFALFASQNSVKSSWVAEEIREATRRIRDRRIKRIIVYCADKATFKILDATLKEFNIVRVEQTPLVCARQIRGILAEVYAENTRTEVFVARDENLADLKRLIIDPARNFRTLAVSGFDRLGRRTLIRKLCQDVYGSFNIPTQSIVIDSTYSPDDIFRQLLALQYSTLERTELAAQITAFGRLGEREQIKRLSSEIRAIYEQREFVQFVDGGGIIDDDGDLSNLFAALLSENTDISDLIHILVLYRSPPDKIRKKYTDIAFYRIPPLTDAQSEIALLHELKKRKTTLSRDKILRLVALCDGHPANLDFLVGYLFHETRLNPTRLDEVLGDSSEFANWKRGRASAYIGKFEFAPLERLLIGLLIRYRALPAESIVSALQSDGLNPQKIGEAIARLLELNVIDIDGSQYRLIRPLRDALERDSRFTISARQSDDFAKRLVESISNYDKGDSVPIALIDSATLATIRSGKVAAGWIGQLILPSHYVWLTRESYHRREYQDSLEFASKALGLSATMSADAKLECLRFAGLSCARLGLEKKFSETMDKLAKLNHRRSSAFKHFLQGFYFRLHGEIEQAHSELLKAAELSKGSIDVQRELISVLLARRQFEAALSLAKELVQRADTNPYVLDGYIQAQIAATPQAEKLDYDGEFIRLFDRLEEVGDGPGLAFYALRKVDIALKRGAKGEALQYANHALTNAPNLPAAHAARAKALIALGDFDRAWIELQAIEELGSRKARLKDGLEKLLLYQIRFDYNLQKRRYELCKLDIENIRKLDSRQAKEMKMDLVVAVAKSGVTLDAALTQWLKS